MTRLVVIPPDELEAIIDARLRIILKGFFENNQGLPDNVPGQAASPYVTKKEAAGVLRCSPGTVSNLARAGKLKRLYVGKSLRFSRSEVLNLARATQNTKLRATN